MGRYVLEEPLEDAANFMALFQGC